MTPAMHDDLPRHDRRCPDGPCWGAFYLLKNYGVCCTGFLLTRTEEEMQVLQKRALDYGGRFISELLREQEGVGL